MAKVYVKQSSPISMVFEGRKKRDILCHPCSRPMQALHKEMYNQVFFTDNIPQPAQSVLKNRDQVTQLTPSTMVYHRMKDGHSNSQNQEVKTFVNKIRDLNCNWR